MTPLQSPPEMRVGIVVPQMSVEEALAALGETPHAVLPIYEEDTGRLLAVLSRPAPPASRLGGMATPLGVYLTDGVRSGGAGFAGLFLTGVLLSVMAILAQAASGELTAFVHWKISDAPALQAWLSELSALIPTALIFLLLRLSPLAGTHAAEHQVVHCIERGLPLTPDQVRAMPRVHPRCGTNLLVGVTLFLLIFVGVFGAAQSARFELADAATLSLLLAAPVALALRLRLGGWVQQHFATRPATSRQIAGAIQAAEQLLARRDSPPALSRFRFPRRLWSMGLSQVMIGYFAVTGLLALAARFWPRLGAWVIF